MTDGTVLPRYPIYVPSKGRVTMKGHTARFLTEDGVPFRLVVEAEEREVYADRFGAERVLVLPESGQGLIYARNWIKAHATAEGHVRHWQLDDNIRFIARMYRGRRIRCPAGAALAATEDFTERYTNVAVSGLNYWMFGCDPSTKPFTVNHHVYSCSLVLNALPYVWRSRYNDDTDYCLQVLAGGWCTLLLSAFLIYKETTMKVGGGNTADLYQGDGRLKMARSLERLWPGVVKTGRRFKRPQHFVKDAWRRFDTQLIPRPDLDLDALAGQSNEYGLTLRAVREVKSAALRALLPSGQEETS